MYKHVMSITSLMSVGLLLVLASRIASVQAFVPASSMNSVNPTVFTTVAHSTSDVSLRMANLFGGLFGNGGGSNNGAASSNGVETLFTLPTTKLKKGPLQFFLKIYLVAAQNEPTPGSWAIGGDESNLDSINAYYKDGTGMVSVVLNDNSIEIQRHGKSPSLQMVLQESLLLHGLLDELQSLAENEEVEAEKRLVQWVNGKKTVDDARSTLPARQD
ncbi:unnamed protein product [Cylindrotheca closterium]|uniref:Uncharacterized protein n=1 Tax=Cylindrotheca closterium TaxID=2856 RepID=A0AAD2FF67_9STRA|nr:unnamed protein product [Cylindrotheca closterium]